MMTDVRLLHSTAISFHCISIGNKTRSRLHRGAGSVVKTFTFRLLESPGRHKKDLQIANKERKKLHKSQQDGMSSQHQPGRMQPLQLELGFEEPA